MPIFFFIGLAALLAYVAFAVYRTGQLLRVWRPQENLLLSPFENIARLVMIGICIGLGLLSGQSPQALGWSFDNFASDVALGAAVGVGISIILLPIGLWVLRHRPHWYNDVVLESVRPRSRRQWPLVILAFLPAALLEELIFRSLLLGGLAPYANVVYLAVAASIFFGLLHLPQGEWGVIGVTIVGLVFSALFLWRGSLWLVVSAHWVANIGQIIQAEFASHRGAGTSNG